MSSKTITQLPIVTSRTETDVIPIVQNGVTSQISLNHLPNRNILYVKNSNNQEFSVADDEWQQINFGNLGDMGNTTDGAVLKPSGDLILSEVGYYRIDVRLQLSRQGAVGSGGNTVIGVLPMVSDRVIDFPYVINLPNYQSMDIINYSYVHRVLAYNNGDPLIDTYKLLMTRDSTLSTGAGATQGGLYNIEVGNEFDGKPIMNKTGSAIMKVTKL
jgi:hypothetical protein